MKEILSQTTHAQSKKANRKTARRHRYVPNAPVQMGIDQIGFQGRTKRWLPCKQHPKKREPIEKQNRVRTKGFQEKIFGPQQVNYQNKESAEQR